MGFPGFQPDWCRGQTARRTGTSIGQCFDYIVHLPAISRRQVHLTRLGEGWSSEEALTP